MHKKNNKYPVQQLQDDERVGVYSSLRKTSTGWFISLGPKSEQMFYLYHILIPLSERVLNNHTGETSS